MVAVAKIKAAPSERKIGAKSAVAIALKNFQEFFPKLAASNSMLEELEESSDGKRWFVTIGFDQPNIKLAILGGPIRGYKLFTIDGLTGKVLSVKIRTVG